ncbi:MAG: HTH domain-containing protein [Nitrospirota bacterium]|nr:HTH domain-containing protein [Nitrospirota bacterium]MDE3224824.1 HTH domain-containing protein [Nitrospirota bacterium]MDE3241641.1 HTH domain-containing protein [Nitrospirota bacterium]
MGRPPKAYSQAGRLTAMIRSLASRACTLDDLCQEFGVSRRQVYRNLARIEEEGHPLTQIKDGLGESTWQLPLSYKGLPPVTLSPYELMSLYLAKSHLTYLKDTPFLDDLDGVIAKVRSGLPAKMAAGMRPQKSLHEKDGFMPCMGHGLQIKLLAMFVKDVDVMVEGKRVP